MKGIINHSLNLNEVDKINKQMEKCVCKIYSGDKIGTGFFIKIKGQNNKIYPILVTNNHILMKEDIEKGKEITISINNDDKYIIINIDDSRITFIDDLFESTFVQIKEVEDQFLNTCDYLEIDERTYYKNGLSENESLYILNYPKARDATYSIGSLISINCNEIKYNCNTKEGSSGSPILSLETYKVIGIHSQIGKNSDIEINKGTLINYPIIEFKKYLNDTPIENIKENISFEKNNIKGNIINNIINIPLEKKNNTMTIKYKINNYENQIKIFGKKFATKNQYNCKIIIEGKEQDISEKIDVNEKMKKQSVLEIKLIETRTITDMSYLFGGDTHGCKSLIELRDIDNWDTSNIRDMSHMFQNCDLLPYLPDISKWDTSKVTDMNRMFCNCRSLLYLPDISKWDTSNVTNMELMFESCFQLSYLPDITKWNIEKVINKRMMFFGCNPHLKIPGKLNDNCFIY